MGDRDSRELYRELGDSTSLAGTSLNLAGVAVMQGEAAGATQLIKQALAAFRGLGDPVAVGWALCHQGHVAQLKRDHEPARRLHKEALALFRRARAIGGAAFAEAYAAGQAMPIEKVVELALQSQDGA